MSPADLAFSFFSCPYPPNPLPRRGRGSPRLFHARGFAPCIPGAEPGRRGLNLRWRYPAGGLPSLSPADLAFSFFSCPYPPSPRSQSALPLRGRGSPRLFHARGFAPCIPGAESGRRGLNLRWRCPAGGLPSLSPADLAFSFFSCPYPPDPLPRRGRGSPRLFHARGFAPCIPGAESGLRGLNLRWRRPAGGLPSGAPEQGAKPAPSGGLPG